MGLASPSIAVEQLLAWSPVVLSLDPPLRCSVFYVQYVWARLRRVRKSKREIALPHLPMFAALAVLSAPPSVTARTDVEGYATCVLDAALPFLDKTLCYAVTA